MEEWKFIAGFDNKYQISSYGRVKSMARIIGSGKGYAIPERYLKLNKDKDGYFQVSITLKNRVNKTLRIHYLVYTHFAEFNFSSDYHICHKDGNRENNKISNLYLGNAATNALDKYRQGRTKVTIEQVHEIRLSTKPQKELASIYGVKESYISRVKNYKRATPISRI